MLAYLGTKQFFNLRRKPGHRIKTPSVLRHSALPIKYSKGELTVHLLKILEPIAHRRRPVKVNARNAEEKTLLARAPQSSPGWFLNIRTTTLRKHDRNAFALKITLYSTGQIHQNLPVLLEKHQSQRLR